VQHPEYIYYAAMFLIALPMAAAFRNVVALVVFATWAVGQTAYLIGMPEPETQFALYIAALGLGVRYARSTACTFAAVMFFPLAIVCLSNIVGWMGDYIAWWTIFWMAMTQVLALPFCHDWRAIWRRMRAGDKGGGGQGMLRVAHR
jgi:hypothetical protein